MMPWEHALVGYIGFSLFVHAVYRMAPTATETIAVVVATLLPDLIDKPLAWEFGVFASSRALAHSIFFAGAASLLVGWLAWTRGRPRIGWAFAIGYLLHFPADVIPAYVRDGELRLYWIPWPLWRERGGDHPDFRRSLVDEFVDYLSWIGGQVNSGDPEPYVFVILGIAGLGVLLWIYDGMPVAREAFRSVQRSVVRQRPHG